MSMVTKSSSGFLYGINLYETTPVSTNVYKKTTKNILSYSMLRLLKHIPNSDKYQCIHIVLLNYKAS